MDAARRLGSVPNFDVGITASALVVAAGIRDLGEPARRLDSRWRARRRVDGGRIHPVARRSRPAAPGRHRQPRGDAAQSIWRQPVGVPGRDRATRPGGHCRMAADVTRWRRPDRGVVDHGDHDRRLRRASWVAVARDCSRTCRSRVRLGTRSPARADLRLGGRRTSVAYLAR